MKGRVKWLDLEVKVQAKDQGQRSGVEVKGQGQRSGSKVEVKGHDRGQGSVYKLTADPRSIVECKAFHAAREFPGIPGFTHNLFRLCIVRLAKISVSYTCLQLYAFDIGICHRGVDKYIIPGQLDKIPGKSVSNANTRRATQWQAWY